MDFKVVFCPDNKFLHDTNTCGHWKFSETSNVQSTNVKRVFEIVIQASLMYVCALCCNHVTNQITGTMIRKTKFFSN